MYKISTTDYFKWVKNNKDFNNRLHKIYCMIDPRDDSLFYIGCTSNCIHYRYYTHCTLRETKGVKKQLIDDIINSGLMPQIKVLYSFEDKYTGRMVEKCLINFLSINNHTINLKNRIGTGLFTYKVSDKT